jgi:hypothetical protein
VGAVFGKDSAVEFPDKEQLADVTLTGVPFAGFARSGLQEVLLFGRYGVLVDLTQNSRITAARAASSADPSRLVSPVIREDALKGWWRASEVVRCDI